MNNLEIQYFLNDFESNIQVEFIEDSTQRKNLFEIAKAKGILIGENDKDLAVFKGIWDIVDAPNGNGKILPEKELLQELPKIIGRPITVDHIRKFVVGFVLNYTYIQKEKKVIIWGIIFKSCFPQEYEKMVELFKQKKLGLSSEIWADKKKRTTNPDGSYNLHDFTIAGVTIVMMDKNNVPASPETMILEMSKKKCAENEELIYSMINKNNLENLSCGKDANHNCDKCECLITSQIETTQILPQPNNMKIICQHCGGNFEQAFIPGQTAQIKCTNCFSILDQSGKVLFPPQIRNFDLTCPDCSARNNWLILSKTDKENNIKCQSCAKEYNIKFKDYNIQSEYISKLIFLRTGQISCIQCGTYTKYAVPSTQKTIEVSCQKCKLKFSFDPINESKRDIESIDVLLQSKIEEPKIIKEELKVKKTYILEESKLEMDEDALNIIENNSFEALALEESKALAYAEEKGLPDSAFAVIVNKKDKASGEVTKIRKYPINGTTNDETRVRAALRYLGMPRNQEELKSIGVSSETVKNKVLDRAKELKMEDIIKIHGMEKSKVNSLLKKAANKIKNAKKETVICNSKLEKFVKGMKKFATRIRDNRKEIKNKDIENSTLKQKVEDTKTFYMERSTLIMERKNKLGTFAEGITDEVLVNDNEYNLLTAKKIIAEKDIPKEPTLETSSLKVGLKVKGDDDYYKKMRTEINKAAGLI